MRASTALACALLLAATTARAKERVPPAVQKLVKKMMVDYNAGDFATALAEADEAYHLKPLPGLLFNMGQFHKALKHWERAEFFFHRYLSEKPEAANRELVEKLIEEVKQKEAEAAAPPHPTPSAAIVVVPPSPLATPTSPAPVPAASPAPAPAPPAPSPNAPALDAAAERLYQAGVDMSHSPPQGALAPVRGGLALSRFPP